MPGTAQQRQELINATLNRRAPNAHDSGSGIWAWEKLAAQLIGDGGFCALYERSIKLTVSEFPCLTVPSEQHVEGMLLSLRNNFAAVDVSKASRANLALLQSYTGLLSTLIGESLTLRILISAWEDKSDKKMENRT
jgi:hypothetical protein